MTVDFLPGTEDNYVVCTSSTRPPGREGTMIYETDTDKTYVYNGSVWVQQQADTTGVEVMMWMTRV